MVLSAEWADPMARVSPRRNLRSSLRGRPGRGDGMAAYDRLPPDLRVWLAQAALPWSTRSALRAWRRALRRCGGDPVAARDRLDRIERAMLLRDKAVVAPRQDERASAPT
ncbi:DUF6525 family protein [Jannaschia marina]|uniref:DUF6525 family protein n=1 Tax=Jannaschia marina TaxID=2741674 RepID=UPI002E290B34|nr:DUF6525 family protein [Jannaschia marina]